ncbi:MAG TPA: potassium channel family protein [Rudaea sp.]|nr:potassium channel family protein [Rudaea sp.]
MEKIVGQAVARARQKPFFWLFVFAMVVLLFAPLMLDNRFMLLVLNVVYLRALWLNLSEGGMRKEAKIILWGFWAAALGLRLAAPDSIDGNLMYVASRLCTVVVLGACVVLTMRHVLREIEVTIDSIFAAIVAYVFAALAFAAAYSALYVLAPASFHFPDAVTTTENGAVELQTIYFSFVTIATLGYGDITPHLPFSQMLVVCEAMFGQFYVAVVLAWLVSMYASHRQA